MKKFLPAGDSLEFENHHDDPNDYYLEARQAVGVNVFKLGEVRTGDPKGDYMTMDQFGELFILAVQRAQIDSKTNLDLSETWFFLMRSFLTGLYSYANGYGPDPKIIATYIRYTELARSIDSRVKEHINYDFLKSWIRNSLGGRRDEGI